MPVTLTSEQIKTRKLTPKEIYKIHREQLKIHYEQNIKNA